MIWPIQRSQTGVADPQEKVCSEDVHRLGEVVISLKGKVRLRTGENPSVWMGMPSDDYNLVGGLEHFYFSIYWE